MSTATSEANCQADPAPTPAHGPTARVALVMAPPCPDCFCRATKAKAIAVMSSNRVKLWACIIALSAVVFAVGLSAIQHRVETHRRQVDGLSEEVQELRELLKAKK